jgi:hypothetical protein
MVQAGTILGNGTPSAPVKNSEVAGFGSSSPVSERLALAAQGAGPPIQFAPSGIQGPCFSWEISDSLSSR